MSSRRFIGFGIACLAGIVLLTLFVPRFRTAQPLEVSITRSDARAIADRAAREFDIPVDDAWVLTNWEPSWLLVKELERDPEAMEKARHDPVVGPRLGYFRVSYFRRGLEKWPDYGYVMVTPTGEVLAVRKRLRNEEAGAKPQKEDLRAEADAIVAQRRFIGAGELRFEEARDTTLNNRTDITYRYVTESEFPLPQVKNLIYVVFAGDQWAGWVPIEEYADGTPFRYEGKGELITVFVRAITMYVLLLVLLVIFLRKYHAGEVGIRTGGMLFVVVAVIALAIDIMFAAENSFSMNFGGEDARVTALASGGLMFLFSDIPMAVLVFLAWSVGESYARERWGEKLASFDALLRRRLFNRTVGRSVIEGLLAAPAVAAASFFIPFIAVIAGAAYPHQGVPSFMILGSRGGPLTMVLWSLFPAITIAVISVLFFLALTSRKKMLWLGFLLAAATGALLGASTAPVLPLPVQFTSGLGVAAAAAALFLAADLLAAAVGLFGGMLLVAFLPILGSATGDFRVDTLAALAAPLLVLALFGTVGMLRREEIGYEYSSLAPHVKRIVERERVKAEIDAANRIQAALLPVESPRLETADVATHYRSATEIGGDYFDFLPLPDGRLGLAFGDVAGHGLTSGIVMAMAKSALLVQIDYDATPDRMLEKLNEIVMKTAPRRMLMTFFFGLLDPATGTLSFSSAGHLDPYVWRASTGKLEALSLWGFPLGVRRREPFKVRETSFAPGDRLILYSDGLIEAIDDDGEPFGFARFERVIAEHSSRSAEEIKQAVLKSVRKFTGNRPPEDDQTLVVLSFEDRAVRDVRRLA